MPETTVETPVPALTAFQEWAAQPEVEVASEAEIDTASATEPASEPETVVEEKEEKLPKGLKKRFSSLTSEIRELRAALAAKPAAVAEVTPGLATPPIETVKADQAGKPVAANFVTYEQYVEALTDWKLEARDALQKQVAARESQAETVKIQVAAARTRHADYDDVVTNDVPISPAMAEVMVSSEHGAEIAYYLGSNPAEAARIGKLTPAQAGAALARIEAGLEIPSTQPKQRTATTKAPAPPKTLTGSGGNADAEPDGSDFSKWNKWKDREERRKNADDD